MRHLYSFLSQKSVVAQFLLNLNFPARSVHSNQNIFWDVCQAQLFKKCRLLKVYLLVKKSISKSKCLQQAQNKADRPNCFVGLSALLLSLLTRACSWMWIFEVTTNSNKKTKKRQAVHAINESYFYYDVSSWCCLFAMGCLW